MIRRLRGLVREQTQQALLLDVQGVCYQVLIPPSVMQRLGEKHSSDGIVELVVFHYQQLEPGRGFDVLIGFLNEVEREFFERFISVSGVGPKAALRALTLSIPTIARAIDEADLTVLKSLPGIGEQRGKEIIAKLQGKVGKFALIQPGHPTPSPTPVTDGGAEPSQLEEEATAILLQLEYTRPEANAMIRAAVARNPKLKTAEELLNEVYRQRRSIPEPLAQPAPPKPSRKPKPAQPEPEDEALFAAETSEDPYAV